VKWIRIMIAQRVARAERDDRQGEMSPGIVVVDTRNDATEEGNGPRIAAFIWGGKVRPAPTLPYGRWRGAA